MNPKIVELF